MSVIAATEICCSICNWFNHNCSDNLLKDIAITRNTHMVYSMAYSIFCFPQWSSLKIVICLTFQHSLHELPADPADGMEKDKDGDDAVEAILKATGLQSDSDDAAHSPPVKKAKKGRKQEHGEQTLPVLEDRSREPLNSEDKSTTAKISKSDRHQQDSSKQSLQQAAEKFDYSASQASAPGLHLDFNTEPSDQRGDLLADFSLNRVFLPILTRSWPLQFTLVACLSLPVLSSDPLFSCMLLMLQTERHWKRIPAMSCIKLSILEFTGRRGRGGRGGGRGRARAPPVESSDSFSLYKKDDSKFMKGGKRSSLMPRSGNRNSIFGS